MNNIKTYICTDSLTVPVFNKLTNREIKSIKKGDTIKVIKETPMMYILENDLYVINNNNFQLVTTPKPTTIKQEQTKTQDIKDKPDKLDKQKKPKKKTIPKKVKNDV